MFPEIKDSSDTVLVKDIPPKRAAKLLRSGLHNVSSWHPEYLKKALKWLKLQNGRERMFGLFNKHSRDNALALATVIEDAGPEDAAYVHEMTGFIKGAGYGRQLIEKLVDVYNGKLWLQVGPDETKPEGPERLNWSLWRGVYSKIPGVQQCVLEDSVWEYPVMFAFWGIDKKKMEDWLQREYGKQA